MAQLATAPAHLSAEAAELFDAVAADYNLTADLPGLAVLKLACESLDEAERDRQLVAQHGEVFRDRFGQWKPSPAVAIGDKAAIRAARMLRELALDGSLDGPETRLPRYDGSLA